MSIIWEPFGPFCLAADAPFARFPEEVSGRKASGLLPGHIRKRGPRLGILLPKIEPSSVS